jgi:hypothetical protein
MYAIRGARRYIGRAKQRSSEFGHPEGRIIINLFK